mmetsp:Transcript_21676/g.47931  ORF Transcript_21676/g.47931 Transcript_21676/m.47931 type:complete len:85 (-) Transcript_21676:471-725(-)
MGKTYRDVLRIKRGFLLLLSLTARVAAPAEAVAKAAIVLPPAALTMPKTVATPTAEAPQDAMEPSLELKAWIGKRTVSGTVCIR